MDGEYRKRERQREPDKAMKTPRGRKKVHLIKTTALVSIPLNISVLEGGSNLFWFELSWYICTLKECIKSRLSSSSSHQPLMDTLNSLLSLPCSLETSQVTPSFMTSTLASKVRVLTTLGPSTDTDCGRERGTQGGREREREGEREFHSRAVLLKNRNKKQVGGVWLAGGRGGKHVPPFLRASR